MPNGRNAFARGTDDDVSCCIYGAGRGGANPHGRKGRRILSLISDTLQGVASRRSKSQQVFYLHIDIGIFEVAI